MIGAKSVVAHFASPLEFYHLDVLRSVRMVTNALAVPMRNVAPGRTRYRIDPAAHIALRRVLRVIEPGLQGGRPKARGFTIARGRVRRVTLER